MTIRLTEDPFYLRRRRLFDLLKVTFRSIATGSPASPKRNFREGGKDSGKKHSDRSRVFVVSRPDWCEDTKVSKSSSSQRIEWPSAAQQFDVKTDFQRNPERRSRWSAEKLFRDRKGTVKRGAFHRGSNDLDGPSDVFQPLERARTDARRPELSRLDPLEPDNSNTFVFAARRMILGITPPGAAH